MLHETLDHDLLEKSLNLLPFESDNTITYRLSLHFQCVPMWQDVVRLIKEFGILLQSKSKYTLWHLPLEGALWWSFAKDWSKSWSIHIRVHMSCQLIYGLAKSILSIEQQLLPTWWAFQFRFHIGFFKSVCILPFIQDLCLCIGFL